MSKLNGKNAKPHTLHGKPATTYYERRLVLLEHVLMRLVERMTIDATKEWTEDMTQLMKEWDQAISQLDYNEKV